MLEKIANKNSYNRFKKIFKKGEQICIIGSEWDSHGYITNIEDSGITLTGIKNQKTIKYPWDCFEVVCHPGYKIKKASEVEVANIFDIKFSIDTPPPPMEIIDLGKSSIKYEKSTLNKNVFYFFSDYNLKFKEVIPDFKHKEGKYKDLIAVDFKIRGFETHHRECTPSESCGWMQMMEGFLYPTNKINKIEICTYGNLRQYNTSNLTFYKNFRSSIFDKPPMRKTDIGNNKELDMFRRNKKIERTYSAGDPVIFDGELIDYKIWKSSQGFLMANFYADIYI